MNKFTLFLDEAIDKDAFECLNENNIQKLVPKIGHQIKLLKLVKNLKDNSNIIDKSSAPAMDNDSEEQDEVILHVHESNNIIVPVVNEPKITESPRKDNSVNLELSTVHISEDALKHELKLKCPKNL